MGQRREPDLVAERSRGFALRRAVDRRGTGVDDPLDLVFQGDRRLEDRERADHVHRGSQDRIGPARGGLQARQVQHVGRLHPLDRRTHRGGIGDVPREEVDPTPLLGVEQQVEPMRVLFQVIDPDLLPPLDQALGHPRPDAPVAAGYEYPHETSSRGDNRPIPSIGPISPAVRRSRDGPTPADDFNRTRRPTQGRSPSGVVISRPL
jgi:hypothetical protein